MHCEGEAPKQNYRRVADCLIPEICVMPVAACVRTCWEDFSKSTWTILFYCHILSHQVLQVSLTSLVKRCEKKAVKTETQKGFWGASKI